MHITKPLCAALAALLLFSNSFAAADPAASGALQSGEMALEDTRQRPVPASQRAKASVEKWLDSLDQSFRSGAVRPVEGLDDAGVSYMASLYLFCAVRAGGCPFILDTVLESDVILSKGEKAASCPTMSRFWKAWLAGDFDERSRYSIAPATAERLDAFNTAERPRYVRCKDTVALILADRSNFEARYSENGVARQSFEKTRKLLQEIWEKQIDITAVGR